MDKRYWEWGKGKKPKSDLERVAENLKRSERGGLDASVADGSVLAFECFARARVDGRAPGEESGE